MSLFRLRPEIDVEIETVEGKRTARVLLPGRTITVPIEVVDAFFEPIAPSREVPPPPVVEETP